MRYGIFSDIHANLEAFEAVLEAYKKEKIDRFVCLGDIVGYGVNPNECLKLVKNLNPVGIAGNHDWAVLDKISPAYFNLFAKEAVIWTKKVLQEKAIRYLNNLSLIYQENDFSCVHGSLDNPEKFNYIIDSLDAENTFSLLKGRICFVGHSHKMESFCLNQGRISFTKDYQLNLQKEAKYIINTGSVGQPRDRDPRACFCVYDSQKGMISFRRVEYNIKKAADKILKAGLPPLLAERLYLGR